MAKSNQNREITSKKKSKVVENTRTTTKTVRSAPNWFKRLLFLWAWPLFYKGNRRDLEEDDLVQAPERYKSESAGDRLERKWFEEQLRSEAKGTKPSFTKALMKAFGGAFIFPGFLVGFQVALRTVQPLFFAQLLAYWSVDSTITQQEAVTSALILIGINWTSVFFIHHGNFLLQQFGMKLRVATGSVMYRKILRMDNKALGSLSAGKVVNLLANDLSRFDLAFQFLHYIWIIPLQMVAIGYLGYLQAGYAALIGIAALIVIALPIQGGISKLMAKTREKTAVRTDKRIKIMSEVISGIQVIKMYAWEIPFEKVVKAARAFELKQIRIASYLRVLFLGFMIFTERTALFITILTYSLLGNTISANVVYPLQQFFSSAQLNIALFLPLTIAFAAELFVTIKRVDEFMSVSERPDLIRYKKPMRPTSKLFSSFKPIPESLNTVEPIAFKTIPEENIVANKYMRRFSRSVSFPNDIVVELRHVKASWTGDPNFLTLNNISLRLRQGKLCAVIGAVGSGKSSILQLLLKELPAASGGITVSGSMSYASQEAWLFPSSVRENILFGLPYNANKYKQVCRACCLEKDFKQFPYGDQTLVGERGVSLSGGQRARINLARAVYKEADIYLLDDPLSAVDANVGKQLFEGCISGYLRGTTRILVTHQIHYLKAADFIVVLNQGSVENMGTYDELVASAKDFTLLLSALQEGKDSDSLSTSSVGSLESDTKLRRVSSSLKEEIEEQKVQTMAPEERQSGKLKFEVVLAYFRAGGHWTLLLGTLLIVVCVHVAAACTDFFVSYWMNQMASYEETLAGVPIDPSLSTLVGSYTIGQYLMIHGILVAIVLLLTLLRTVPFAQICVNASKSLHNKMFSVMLRGVMRFFDTSSSGRILNRFSKDMGALDEILPRTLLDVVQIYSILFTILVLNAISLYWSIIPSVVLLILFFILVTLYLNMAQSVKRLEGTTKSPVFGAITSTLNGLPTIRSVKAEDRLIKEFDRFQDVHTSAWNCFLGGGVTFGFTLDTICTLYLIIIIGAFIYIDFGDIIPVGSVGLAVTQSLTLTAMLQHGARMLVEFLAQLTSVERIIEYTRIEQETNLFEGKLTTPANWPSAGRIEFSKVYLRYAMDEAPVLKNLNFNVKEGWKVGIVGRTGAGKSSLISALFRFAHIDGTITIDGVDSSVIARQDLRSKISIIPQEPVLFSATLRYNLDPFNLYSDEEMWRALEKADLKSSVPSLDFEVSEGGANFSVGQRQLICLARAILRSNKILIMDEATANVDPQTDAFIQKTIRKQFADCTVLTIAHRLNTIMDSDRVLVMDTGVAIEFDHPFNLLSNINSHFTSMVKETGEKMAVQLYNVAKEAYFEYNSMNNAR